MSNPVLEVVKLIVFPSPTSLFVNTPVALTLMISPGTKPVLVTVSVFNVAKVVPS